DVELRPDGFLNVTLSIDKQYHVPRTSKATVRAVGFFGDVAVALTPRLGGSLAEVFASGDTVPAGPPEPGVAEIMAHADSTSVALNKITHAMQVEVVDAGGLRDLRSAIASTATLAAEMHAVLQAQSDNLTATLASYRRVADAVDTGVVDSTLSGLRETSRHMSLAAARLDTGATQLNDILARLRAGQGTAGQLLTDTLLYRNLRNTAASLDSLLTDIKKNPGRYISVHIF
ncbi:MAG: hypothetical protein KGJ70_05410, partial [Gemmatimonadota bacterium]|nr:hypothetical protein [Gemmatimonadota bacterium]